MKCHYGFILYIFKHSQLSKLHIKKINNQIQKKNQKKQQNIQMQKRLVSENMIQLPNLYTPSSSSNSASSPLLPCTSIQSQFSAYGSFIAYRIEQNVIRIKTSNKDIKDVQIKAEGLARWYLCGGDGRVYAVVEGNGWIQIYCIEGVGTEVRSKIIDKIPNARNSVPLKQGIAYLTTQNHLKHFLYRSHTHTPISTVPPNSLILPHEGPSIYLLSLTPAPILHLFQKSSLSSTTSSSSSLQYQESPLIIDYITNPIAIYEDKYIFNDNKENKQIQIYDVFMSKMVGKFAYEGNIVRILLKECVFVVVSVKENMDRYYFYTLNDGTNGDGSLILYKSVSQKGKASCYQAYLCSQQQAQMITQGKPLKQPSSPSKDNKILVLYVQPQKKPKIELLKISTAKIRQESFKQKQCNTVILSKMQNISKNKSPLQSSISPQQNPKKSKQSLQIEKTRISTSIAHTKKGQNIEELQKQLIQKIVEIKIKGLLQKFDKLEKRLILIQNQISDIHKKIQKSLEKINYEQVQKNIQKLFEKVTPQFQSYFKEVFRQISGVLDQGVNYYNMKLVKESQIHREAFTHVINMTFDAAQQITELGRKELEFSEKTSESLQKLVMIRKKWQGQLLQFAQAFKPGRSSAVQTNNYDISLSSQNLSPDKKSPPQNANKKN